MMKFRNPRTSCLVIKMAVIDFIITRDDGAMLGIDVKVASIAQRSDFRHLKWFRDRISETDTLLLR